MYSNSESLHCKERREPCSNMVRVLITVSPDTSLNLEDWLVRMVARDSKELVRVGVTEMPTSVGNVADCPPSQALITKRHCRFSGGGYEVEVFCDCPDMQVVISNNNAYKAMKNKATSSLMWIDIVLELLKLK